MINSDQIHVAMTRMRGRVVTLDCQSNIFIEKENEKLEQSVDVHAERAVLRLRMGSMYAVGQRCSLTT